MIKNEDYRSMAMNYDCIMNRYVNFIRQHMALSPKGVERNRKKGYYEFIPTFGTDCIYTTLIDIKKRIRDIRPTFLDAGCGIGNMMVIAEYAGFRTIGIEYNRKTANVATKLSSGQVHIGDILKYGDYDKCDVIYYYQPIISPSKMREFIEKLVRDMKVGAYVIPNGRADEFHESREFKRLNDTPILVFQKMKQEVM